MRLSRLILALTDLLLVVSLGLSMSQSIANDNPDLYASAKHFRLHDVQGKPAMLNQFAGRPLLINYWATWCAPCVREMPELDAFSKRSGVQVVGITIDDVATVAAFLNRVRVSFPILVETVSGSRGSASVLGDTVGALPYSVLIDAEGNVLRRKHGSITRAELDVWLEELSKSRTVDKREGSAPAHHHI